MAAFVLSPKQRAFMGALLAAPSLGEAATRAGISERTATRYLQSADFRRELQAAQDAAFAQATRAVVARMTEAAETLAGIMQDADAPTGARVSAARALLDAGPRLTEITEVLQRLAEVERRIDEKRS